MPRESIFRRLPVQSPARRRLFGEADHEDLNRRLQNELDSEMNEQSRRWSFDFRNDVPIHGDDNNNPSSSTSASSSSANYIYQSIAATQVPIVYRPNSIIRTEITGLGVVEVKTYPTGLGPIETPDEEAIGPSEHVVPEPHSVNPRKRNLPTPLKSPMKLRKRASPHKTPINPGPKPSEHLNGTSVNKRPRRNLNEKFKLATSSAVTSSTTTTSTSSEYASK